MAREYLETVRREGIRVAAGEAESVHDFRVALRRLRNWLRLWRPYLADTVGKRSEQRFRRFSHLAGHARDLEVQFAALTASGTFRGAPARHAALHFAEIVAVEQRRSRKRLWAVLRRALTPAAAALDRELENYGPEREAAAGCPEPRAGPVLARLIRVQEEALVPKLRALRSGGRVQRAHQARIAVKRLRYLLESIGRSSRDAVAAARRLAVLQDLLGKLHDAQLLDGLVAAHGSRSGAMRALRAQLRARVTRIFGAVCRTRDSGSFRMARSRIARVTETLERDR